MIDDPVPISALEHFTYCPRQCALILVDGIWSDNEHTARGDIGHRRADTPSQRLERGRTVARAVPLWSEVLGLTGRADAVEEDAERRLIPVEYKIGSPQGRTAQVQLCAEAFCLEEMTGRPVAEGAVWYATPRRRHRVAFDAELRNATRYAIAAVRALMESQRLPAAVDDRRCQSCQLESQCLPSVVGPQLKPADLTERLFA